MNCLKAISNSPIFYKLFTLLLAIFSSYANAVIAVHWKTKTKKDIQNVEKQNKTKNKTLSCIFVLRCVWRLLDKSKRAVTVGLDPGITVTEMICILTSYMDL